MSREQLEARAKELGITFNPNIKDETLAKKIAEAEAEVDNPIAEPKAMGETAGKRVVAGTGAYARGEFKSGNSTIIRN